jgi:hypothetical protein
VFYPFGHPTPYTYGGWASTGYIGIQGKSETKSHPRNHPRILEPTFSNRVSSNLCNLFSCYLKSLSVSHTDNQAPFPALRYYPSSPTADYDEESVCVPSNFIEQLVHDWEDAATLPPEVDTRLVKVRIGVVLG